MKESKTLSQTLPHKESIFKMSVCLSDMRPVSLDSHLQRLDQAHEDIKDQKVQPFFFFKILFIHERHRERERQRYRQREAPCKEPDVGLNPRNLGSGFEPKADAQPLNHPGILKIQP